MKPPEGSFPRAGQELAELLGGGKGRPLTTHTEDPQPYNDNQGGTARGARGPGSKGESIVLRLQGEGGMSSWWSPSTGEGRAGSQAHKCSPADRKPH